ncbi:MAG: hypothetical protein IJY92_04620 [Alphaproteobacteria bacterium]|nr:hypothetical protein [Alphaproteobacteria bacterium]
MVTERENIAEGFAELESELQAEAAKRQKAEKDAIVSGLIFSGATGANAAIWKATAAIRGGAVSKEAALKRIGAYKVQNSILLYGTKMGQNSNSLTPYLKELAEKEGLKCHVIFENNDGVVTQGFVIEDSPKARAFLERNVLEGGRGLTNEALDDVQKIREARLHAQRGAEKIATLSDDALGKMGGTPMRGYGIIHVDGMKGANSHVDVSNLQRLAKAENINFTQVVVNDEGTIHSAFNIEDTPKGRAFLKKYMTPDGKGLTLEAQKALKEGLGGLSDAALKKMGGTPMRGYGIIHVDGMKGANSHVDIQKLKQLAKAEKIKFNEIVVNDEGAIHSAFNIEDTPEGRAFLKKYMTPDGKGLTDEARMAADELDKLAAARKVASDAKTPKPKAGRGPLKGSLKWGLRGVGAAFGAWAAYNFVSDVVNLGTAGGSAGADGVALQNAIPSQFAGKIAPRDSKYFTKGSPEEMKFRAMVAYAAMQEGGFMGKTQEEWQEYAVRLSQAEGGIISPTGELKIRKGLVAVYDKHKDEIDKTLVANLSGHADSDATRGLQNAGAEAVGTGRGAPAASKRRRGGGSRAGI